MKTVNVKHLNYKTVGLLEILLKTPNNHYHYLRIPLSLSLLPFPQPPLPTQAQPQLPFSGLGVGVGGVSKQRPEEPLPS